MSVLLRAILLDDDTPRDLYFVQTCLAAKSFITEPSRGRV